MGGRSGGGGGGGGIGGEMGIGIGGGQGGSVDSSERQRAPGNNWYEAGASFWGTANFENNYGLHLGRVVITIWHFELWGSRLRRLLPGIQFRLS